MAARGVRTTSELGCGRAATRRRLRVATVALACVLLAVLALAAVGTAGAETTTTLPQVDNGTDLRSIDYGETRTGAIDAGDPTGYRGNYEPVTFAGTDGDTISISMQSEAGDSYLVLLDPDGEVVARNNDGGVSGDARIDDVTLRANGEYTIVATSYTTTGAFEYSLSLETTGGTTGNADLRSIDYGQTRSGQVDAGDPRSQTYRGYYEPVTFQGTAGDIVTINMTTQPSSAYTRDTYLMLLGPDGEVITENDDGGTDYNARIQNQQLPATGQYTIIATTYTSDATFRYNLSLNQAEGGADLRTIGYNETATGEIDDGDPVGYRGNYEPVTFAGSVGDAVTIEMSAESGDAHLLLLGPDGEVVTESPETTGAATISEFRLPESGEYTIVATSGADDGRFTYQLSLRRVTLDRTLDLRSISYGETLPGRIDGEDPTGYRGNYEPVTFAGSAGDRVRVNMTSVGDTYLMILGPGGNVVARNDDGGAEFDARIDGYVLPADGEYTIVATSFDPDARFTYQLSLSRVGTADISGIDLRSISYNASGLGELNPGDPTGYSGYYEPVTFQGSAGDVISVGMEAPNGDAVVGILGPDGRVVASNDDGGQGRNSRLDDVVLFADGEYTIVATSFDPEGTFRYRLSLDRTGTVDTGRTDLRSLGYGETAVSELQSSDPEGYRGNYEPVRFLGSAGDNVTVEMSARRGDAYLMLVGPDGSVVAENDDGGSGLDARISGHRLPAAGEYTVVATSFQNSSTFRYTLSLSSDADRATDPVSLNVTGPPVRPNATVTVNFTLSTEANRSTPGVLSLTEYPSDWSVVNRSDGTGPWNGSRWVVPVPANGSTTPTVTFSVPANASGNFTIGASVSNTAGVANDSVTLSTAGAGGGSSGAGSGDSGGDGGGGGGAATTTAAGPGFGPLAALVALVATGLLARRRQ